MVGAEPQSKRRRTEAQCTAASAQGVAADGAAAESDSDSGFACVEDTAAEDELPAVTFAGFADAVIHPGTAPDEVDASLDMSCRAEYGGSARACRWEEYSVSPAALPTPPHFRGAGWRACRPTIPAVCRWCLPESAVWRSLHRSSAPPARRHWFQAEVGSSGAVTSDWPQRPRLRRWRGRTWRAAEARMCGRQRFGVQRCRGTSTR
eukprot:TRINITY_DN12339_c0_g1_i3.p1 TRINITY_DN12339_c0_g1~~TRINITY_DN12339_c0_g1_i3.p1  ORF type:complete len:206 (+),score=2.38 TRINITY_DN12339_c0_g1_i3:46-663(+)